MSLEIVRAAALNGAPHGFFGSRGDLNCGFGSGAELARVEANRRTAADAIIAGAEIASVHQIHSPDAVIVREAVPRGERAHADALVTDRRGLLLGIVTADCAPVLLADVEAGVVGAAHAGWRGAVAGVTHRTIAAMISLGARVERIAAAVGPCIAQRNYEVDQDFAERLLSDDAGAERFFADGPRGQPHFDLEAYVVARLAAAGIRRIEAAGLDTYGDAERFYSYRRATHRGEADYGRQISLIGLAP